MNFTLIGKLFNFDLVEADGGTGWLRSNYPCNVNAVLYY